MHLIRRHAAQDNNSCLRRIRAIATYYLPLEKLHRAGRSWLRYRRLWRRTSVSIFINQTVAPLNDVAVRQALAYCVDRSRVSQIGEYGYEPPANQTGITPPTFSSWLDTAEAAATPYTYDPTKAESILTAQ